MSSGGGLLDLVARGKKDTFFTSNPKISFFHSVYPKQPAFTQEIRFTQPRNNPIWGKWVDFEIESVGDIVKNFVLLIDLPSWLPVAQANFNPTSITTDLSGVEYGYTQDIGAAMIDKVQVFNDQLLLHEFWGQWLEWRVSQQPNSTIYGILAGRHLPGSGQIAKAATPRRIRITLPIMGNQFPDDMGFPMVALSNQRFRIRVYLKKLEEVIETSDGRLNPNPWSQTFQQQTTRTTLSQKFQTLAKNQMGPLIMTLETTQIYISRDSQEFLRKTVINLPFQQTQKCQFTIEDPKWAPVVTTNVTVSLPLPLDFIGAASRITVGVQTEASQQAGQWYQMSPPFAYSYNNNSLIPKTAETATATGFVAQTFLSNLRLNMGTLDRITAWSDKILRDVANYYKNYKESRDPYGGVQNIYTLTFGPKEKDPYKPIGTFNLSRTLQAVLYVDLNAIAADPRSKSRKSYIIVFGESWNIFEIMDGKGKVMFAD